jgi:Tol biopolymer transport system component
MAEIHQDRLSSWKEIAAFLRCSEKTAGRWEKERGLPVHRVPGGNKGSVWADPKELERWMRGPIDEALASSPPAVKTDKAEPRRRGAFLGIAAGVTTTVVGILIWNPLRHPPRLLAGNPEVLTLSTEAKLPPLMTDGKKVYFQESLNGRFRLMEGSLATSAGQPLIGPLAIPLANPDPGVLSPDGSEMLLRSVQGSKDSDQPLYIQPLPTGTPKRLGDIVAYDSAWTPDQRRIIFARLRSVYEATTAGAITRKLFDVPGRAFHFRWSPRGELRFTVYDSKTSSYQIWRTTSLETQPVPVAFGSKQQCCGEWSPDGKSFTFQSVVDGFWQVFTHSEVPGWFEQRQRVVQLTSGPIHFTSPVHTPDGERLLVLSQSSKSEVVQYSPTTGHWLPLLENIPAATVAYSRDGQWLAYTRIPGYALWRCRMPSCTDPQQLTFPPGRITMPQWSPDGRHIAFMKREFQRTWRIGLVDIISGSVTPLTDGQQAEADPSWSPSGEEIAFGTPANPDTGGEAMIKIINLRSKQTHEVPDSRGFNTPRWSPDGRLLGAVRWGTSELALYEIAARKWRTVPGTRVGYLNWSDKSDKLFFLSIAPGSDPAIKFLDIKSFKIKLAASLSGVRRPSFSFGDWIGLGPSNSLLALRDLSTEQILAWRFEKR